MNIRKSFFVSMFLVFIALFVSFGQSIAVESDDKDESIIHTGKEKAKEMELNPIPVYTDGKGEIIIVPGTLFSIRNGKWSLVNGDMLINVGNRPVAAEGITLNKGEYAIVQNGKAQKQSGSLMSLFIKENKVVIRGNLIRKDGTYVKNYIVQFFELSGNGYKLKIREGKIINPESITDNHGQFKIDVDLSIFESSEGFTILARPNQFNSKLSPLQDRDGNIVRFKVAGDIKDIELGKITVE